MLVTGAASGIGLAVVQRCCSAGADVGALDLNGEGLASAVADLQRAGGGRIVAATADVSDPDQVRHAVNQLGEELGGLNAVVNVAGLGGYTGDVAETSLEAWQRTLAVNLTGVFLVSREALAFLRRCPSASIVNVSSQYGLVGGAGSPAYIASKAGVIGLTRAMAVDHAEENIRVNCVCPGPTDTPMLPRRSFGLEAQRAGEAPNAVPPAARRSRYSAGRGWRNRVPARSGRRRDHRCCAEPRRRLDSRLIRLLPVGQLQISRQTCLGSRLRPVAIINGGKFENEI